MSKKLDELLAQGTPPAVVTEPAPVPIAEVAQRKAEADAVPLWEKKVELDELDKKLQQIERTTGGSGAISRTPKNMMLDASAAQEANPDLHIRWVNVNNVDKVTTHVANGYQRLPESKGGRTLGNLVLMSIPKSEHLKRRAAIRQQVREWLAIDKQGYESFLGGMAQALRDKYGIKITPQQLGGIIRGE